MTLLRRLLTVAFMPLGFQMVRLRVRHERCHKNGMEHYAFSEDVATDYITVVCLQCRYPLYFNPHASQESIELAKTEHRRVCPLNICQLCSKVAGGEIVDPETPKATHGYCDSCFRPIVEGAKLQMRACAWLN